MEMPIGMGFWRALLHKMASWSDVDSEITNYRKFYKLCRRTMFMAYNEIKFRNGNKYYYRVISVRNGNKIGKKRIYLGKNLSVGKLNAKQADADKIFRIERRNKMLGKIKSKILDVLLKYNVKRAGIVGSYARGEQNNNSDIDIIIEAPKGLGYGFVGIAYELEDKLRKKVDLLTYNGISPYFEKSILEDEVRIL